MTKGCPSFSDSLKGGEILFCVFVTDTEIDIARDMFTKEVVTKHLVMHKTEAFVVYRWMVGIFADGDGTLATWLGEQAHRRIFKTCKVDAPTEADIAGGRFATGNHTTCLLDKDATLAKFTTGEVVGGVSFFHSRLHATENGRTEGEVELRLRCGIGVIDSEHQGIATA